MNRLTTCAVLFSMLTVHSSVASAAERTALYPLSQRYQAAVDHFERVVLRIRGIDRNDKRLIDRLDDAATKLRLAARNPRHRNRLFYEWQDVQKLHAEVETRIFGTYTPHHDLTESWNVVAYYFSLFAEEYFFEVENPQHVNSVRRIQNSNSRRSYLRSPALPTIGTSSTPGVIAVPQR